jgi:hypothetical protein
MSERDIHMILSTREVIIYVGQVKFPAVWSTEKPRTLYARSVVMCFEYVSVHRATRLRIDTAIFFQRVSRGGDSVVDRGNRCRLFHWILLLKLSGAS